MNKFHAVILASAMITSFASASVPPSAAAPTTPADSTTQLETPSFMSRVTGTASYLTTPVRNHPYITIVAALALAGTIYYCFADEETEEEAQF